MLGIYKQGTTAEGMKELTIQIPSQGDISSGKRPTEFTSTAIVLKNVTSRQITNDPWLINEIFISSDETEILSFTTNTFAMDWDDLLLSGSFVTNISKTPMWIDLKPFGDSSTIPAIYKQELSQDGKKQLNIQLPSRDSINSGTSTRPTQFTSSSLILIESQIQDCPPTLSCDMCHYACDYTCQVTGKKARKCKNDCESSFCSLFC